MMRRSKKVLRRCGRVTTCAKPPKPESKSVHPSLKGADMAGLAFEALDRHVVAGRGEEPCIYFPSGSMTFAEFLTDTAALAGGLRRLNGDGALAVDLQLEANSDRLRLLL